MTRRQPSPLPALAMLALLAGCATHPSLAPSAGEPRGYVVASVGARLSGPNAGQYESMSINFSHAESGWGGGLRFSSNPLLGTTIAHEDANAKVTVFAIPLRPGSYRIHSWQLSHVYVDGSSQSYRPRKNFSLPFTVAAGEAVYLGEFLGHTTYGEGAFGRKVYSGGFFTRANRAGRDRELIRKAFPETASLSFREADVQAVHPPYIVPYR